MKMPKENRGSKPNFKTLFFIFCTSMMTPSTKRKKFFKKEKRTSRLSKLAPSVAPSDADFDNPPDLGQDDIEVSFFGSFY